MPQKQVVKETGIKTNDFPQADHLDKVGEVACAVAESQTSDLDIENYIGLNSQGRQGRYYRHAAIVLGLIDNTGNKATLTFKGNEFIKLKKQTDIEHYLALCLHDSPVFKTTFAFIADKSPTEAELKDWFFKFYPGKKGTAVRRYTTLKNFITQSKVVSYTNDHYVISKFTGHINKTQKVQIALPAQPVSKKENRIITHEIESQLLERANLIHWKLINCVSESLRQIGLATKVFETVDLVAMKNERKTVFFEMKSINIDQSNLISQMRKAISQLLEYRHFHGTKETQLCIVTNYDIARSEYKDYMTYIEEELQIAYIFTTDFIKLKASKKSQKIIGIDLDQ